MAVEPMSPWACFACKTCLSSLSSSQTRVDIEPAPAGGETFLPFFFSFRVPPHSKPHINIPETRGTTPCGTRDQKVTRRMVSTWEKVPGATFLELRRYSNTSNRNHAQTISEGALGQHNPSLLCPTLGTRIATAGIFWHLTRAQDRVGSAWAIEGVFPSQAVEDAEWSALGGVPCCRPWVDSCASFRSSAVGRAAMWDRDAGVVIQSSQNQQVRVRAVKGREKEVEHHPRRWCCVRMHTLEREDKTLCSPVRTSPLMISIFPRFRLTHVMCRPSCVLYHEAD